MILLWGLHKCAAHLQIFLGAPGNRVSNFRLGCPRSLLSQWAEAQGADIGAVLVKLQRSYKFKRSGYAIHAGAFETVVKAIVPAEPIWIHL